MLRNKIGPSFDAKKVFFFLSFFWLVFLKSHSPCRKKRIFEEKKKKRKIGPSFDSKKAIFGPSFDSTIYIYILLSAKRRAYFCKSIAIEMGGVSRYFSKVSGSGVDLTLLIDSTLEPCGGDKKQHLWGWLQWWRSCYNISANNEVPVGIWPDTGSSS